MNYGMRCHDICPAGSVETVLDAVNALGVHQIQLAMGKSFSEFDFEAGHYSPGFAHYIGNQLKKRDIHVSVLGCYINPTDPDETRRRAEVDKFLEHLKYAKAIGADMVGTETGRFSTDFAVVPETGSEECYQLLLKSMGEIVRAAEKLGVIVGVEGVFDHTLSSPSKMRRFLDDMDSPNVEVILDPVNLVSPEETDRQEAIIQEAFQLYGDKITMMHIKDFTVEQGRQVFQHVGDGIYRFRPLIETLKKQKPYITLLLENSSPDRYHGDVDYLQKIYEEV